MSQCNSDQLVGTVQCEAQTRGCCAVSMWDITRDPVPRSSLTPDGVKRGTRIARMLEHERWESLVQCRRVLEFLGR